MNYNQNYLSLGNFFNLVKKISSNKNSAMQKEIFCSLFNVNDINITTVNNYCIGYRPIGIEYKKVFIDLKYKYQSDYLVFVPTILSLISILDEHIYLSNDQSLVVINHNSNLSLLCKGLLKIAYNDEHIDQNFIDKILDLIHHQKLYECIIEFLLYVVLVNIQPLYIQNINININKEELEEYLKIQLYDGISYIGSLKELSRRNNMYVNAELGSLEYMGLVDGNKNYEKSYNYYLKAALKDHPKACWMVANMILKKKVIGSQYTFELMWEYLQKAASLDSAAAFNTLGNCYLNGITPSKKVNKSKSLFYYNKAAELGYVYAYNNIGLFYEKEKEYTKALTNFKISADLDESWALNRVGEYYRKNNDLETAYMYYLKSSQCPLMEKNYYSYYNLAKYYYLNNPKDELKGLEYLEIAANNGIKEAQELLNIYRKK